MKQWQSKYHLIELDNIDSTNSEAKRIAASGTAEASVIWAHKQTAGRGRYGRVWESGSGNLYMSILIPLACPLAQAAELSFITGLATYEVVNSLVKGNDTQIPISLKWPNDIFIGDNKIGGILLESITHENQTWIIIGLGLNLEHSPEGIGNASSLIDHGMNLSSQNALDLIMESFERYHNMWKIYGFSNIRKLWLEKAYRIGQKVTVGDINNQVTGIFESLDEYGAIQLKLESRKIYTLSTGEMFF